MTQVATSQSSQPDSQFSRIKASIDKYDLSSVTMQGNLGKIYAKTYSVYHASYPTREQVRKDNYNRRFTQMSSMGHQTPMNVPYKPLGETIDVLNSSSDRYKTVYDKTPIIDQAQAVKELEAMAQPTPQPERFSISAFRKNKDLINLQAELNKTRKNIRRVMLGQSFFDLLRNEEEIARKKLFKEKAKAETSMQMRPMIDSDDELEQNLSGDDEAYTELNRYTENASPGAYSFYNQVAPSVNYAETPTNYYSETSVSQEKLSKQSNQKLKLQSAFDYDREANNQSTLVDKTALMINRPQTHPVQAPFNYVNRRMRSISVPPGASRQLSSNFYQRRPKTTVNKKLKENTKPYTPVYTSLLMNEEISVLDRNSITRQLCVLLWLMESISAEGKDPVPLYTCFLVSYFGSDGTEDRLDDLKKFGRKGEMRKLNSVDRSGLSSSQEKRYFTTSPNIEKNWENFVNKTVTKSNLTSPPNVNNQNTTRSTRQARVPGPRSSSVLSLNKNDLTENKDDDDQGAGNKKRRAPPSATPSSDIHDSKTTEDDYPMVPNANVSRQPSKLKNRSTPETNLAINNSTSESMPNENSSSSNNPPTQAHPQTNTSQNFENYSSRQQDTNRDSELTSLDGLTARDSNNINISHLPIHSINESSLLPPTPSATNRNQRPPSKMATLELLTKTPTRPRQKSHSAKVYRSQRPGSNKRMSMKPHEIEIIKIGDHKEIERVLNLNAKDKDRKNLKNLRADTGPIRPLYTQEVLDYKRNAMSAKRQNEIKEVKFGFDNANDVGTFDMHRRLEDLIKKRFSDSRIKYENLAMKELGMHKMMQSMADGLSRHQAEEQKQTSEPEHNQWYTDIEYLVDTHYDRSDLVLKKLLEKLSQHAKAREFVSLAEMVNAKKKNELEFYKTLNTLRIWELLSPDVMSAIEFCRKRVLEVSEEVFDSWFKSKHPNSFVPRTKSAAPEKEAEKGPTLVNSTGSNDNSSVSFTSTKKASSKDK